MQQRRQFVHMRKGSARPCLQQPVRWRERRLAEYRHACSPSRAHADRGVFHDDTR
jgi:hypothetical protein